MRGNFSSAGAFGSVLWLSLVACGPKATPVVAPVAPEPVPAAAGPVEPTASVEPAGSASPGTSSTAASLPVAPAEPPVPVASTAAGEVPYKRRLADLEAGDASVADVVAKELDALVRSQPGDMLLLYNLGVAESRAGRPDVARSHWQRVTGMDPTFAPAYLNLAAVALAQGDTNLALANAREGVRNAPKDVALRVAVVQALTASGKPAEAVDAAKAALLEVGRPDTSLYLALAEACLASDKPTLARFAVEQADLLERLRASEGRAKNWKQDARARSLYAVALARLGYPDEAEDQYKQALALDSANQVALLGAMDQALKDRNYDAALPLAESYAKLQPRDAAAQVRLGVAYLGKGGRAKAAGQVDSGVKFLADAKRAFEGAISLQPGNVDARRNLVLLYQSGTRGPSADIEDAEAAIRELAAYQRAATEARVTLDEREVKEWSDALARALKRAKTLKERAEREREAQKNAPAPAPAPAPPPAPVPAPVPAPDGSPWG